MGSHTAVELILAGQNVVIVDDLSNSSIKVIDRIRTITGMYVSFTTHSCLYCLDQLPNKANRPENSPRLVFYHLSLLDASGLDTVFKNHPKITSVIHFAGLKVCSLLKRTEYREKLVD